VVKDAGQPLRRCSRVTQCSDPFDGFTVQVGASSLPVGDFVPAPPQRGKIFFFRGDELENPPPIYKTKGLPPHPELGKGFFFLQRFWGLGLTSPLHRPFLATPTPSFFFFFLLDASLNRWAPWPFSSTPSNPFNQHLLWVNLPSPKSLVFPGFGLEFPAGTRGKFGFCTSGFFFDPLACLKAEPQQEDDPNVRIPLNPFFWLRTGFSLEV